jgi:antitoxin Phd
MTSLPSSKGRVLLIEDELPILQSYSKSLAGSGFEVVVARRGSEGLEKLKKGNFNVVLTDMVMPGNEGLELLAKIQSGFPDIPVIVMLDAADNRIAIKATELGAIQSLIKPIAEDALNATASFAVRVNHERRRRQRQVLDYRGEPKDAASVTATEAKNEFGKILETVIGGARVFITKHEARKAVLISASDFDALSTAASGHTKLDTLSSEFDALLAEMQRVGARSKMKAAFGASPKQLGQAAVEIAKKRG